MYQLLPAISTAFGTASSAATIPVSMECVQSLGIPQAVYGFTVPLGATINMDGTAIYFPIAVVFLAGVQGIALSLMDYVMITIIAVLSSVGATPIPSSSLVLILMIAEAVNIPETKMFGLIIGFDWLVDRGRTMTNVIGDCMGAACIYQLCPDIDDIESEGGEEVKELE